MTAASDARRFTAYANDESRSRSHVVPDATGFLDAAITFAERWASAHGEVAVTVVDCETGEHQCFRIDLDAGEAQPC